ncbi:MAG: translational GTPase TypA [Spirochaetes bacterium]|jgi:GTP-binding protein|nr:translational GTPase TypA [Spirochaetota bacterium]
MDKIKNIAIIAHVDHGKTTLVDSILKQAGVFRENQHVDERIMDSNDLEKEKGITIFSKNASFSYNGYKINIVDTPGHADFGGEVQRILRMVDSVLLLVDACEGPMPQTKYVLRKSLELGHFPIIVINKIDRPSARPKEILELIFDLFIELDASDEQLDFPIVYASAKGGTSSMDPENKGENLIPLFDTILKHAKSPAGDAEKPFQFLVSAIEYDNFLGRLGTGRIHNGTVKCGDEVVLIKRDGENVPSKITRIYSFSGLKKTEVPEARAGDIVSIAGIDRIDVGETIADAMAPVPLPSINIDEPTISMGFIVNDSPFAGKDGKYVTSRHLWERLQKEVRTNVSIRAERTGLPDTFTVKGRGELQLSILIENMRREGYEFQVSKPEVIYKTIDGARCEPMETAIIDVPEEYAGAVIEKLGSRRGEMINMRKGSDGYSRLEFKVPSRGLIGFLSDFLSDTRGTGILNHLFSGYEPFRGEIPKRNRGSLVQMEDGISVAYALDNLQDRGSLFIGPGIKVYEGMVVGENSRENDMPVNTCKTKKLTNMRAASSDDNIRLTPPRKFSLEEALGYIEDDELLEITPMNIRMRKKILNGIDRKKSTKPA